MLVTNRTGLYFVSNSLHFSALTPGTVALVEQYVIRSLVFGTIAFSHGYPSTTKSGLLDARSTASAAFATGAPALTDSIAARCPPAENPIIPIRCGSIPYAAAFARTHRTALCASSSGTGY